MLPATLSQPIRGRIASMRDWQGTLSLPSNDHASLSAPEVMSKRPSDSRWSDSEKSISRAVSSSTSTGAPPLVLIRWMILPSRYRLNLSSMRHASADTSLSSRFASVALPASVSSSHGLAIARNRPIQKSAARDRRV